MNARSSTSIFLAGAALAALLLALLAGLCHLLLQPGLALYAPVLVRPADWFFALLIAADLGAYVLLCLFFLAPVPAWAGQRIQPFLRTYARLLFFLLRHVVPGKKRQKRLAHAYIDYLNQLVLRRHLRVRPEKILILTPHCLQWDQCPHKITRDIHNCRQCGRCPVGAILALSQAAGAHFAVATGGTLARQIVRDLRPKAIVAIACERDLISGMEDVMPLPVLGLLNRRPNGPCFNTNVDLHALRVLLETLTGESYECT